MTVFLHACRFFPKAGGHMLLVEDNGQFSAYPARFTCRPTMNARATSTTSTAQPTMCQAIDCATKMPHTAIYAALEAISAAFGEVMTLANLMMGIGATIGAYTTEIEWVTLPEG